MDHSQKYTKSPASHRGPERVHESSEDIDIDIRSLLSMLWGGKWIILACMLLSLMVAFLITLRQEKTYTSFATIMIGTPDTNVINLQEIFVNPQFSKETLQNEMEVLRSTNLIERVVNELRLEYDPEFNPELQEEEFSVVEWMEENLPASSSAIQFLRNTSIIEAEASPLTEQENAAFIRLYMIETVLENLSIQSVNDSRVILISYSSPSPRTAARVVNAVAGQYIVDKLEAQLQANQSATDWLSVRSEELRIRAQQAQERLEQARVQQDEEIGQSPEITQIQLASATDALLTAQAELAGVSAAYERLKAAYDGDSDFGAVSEFRDAPLIQEYRRQQSALETQKVALRENHPDRTKIEAQVASLQERIKEEAGLSLIHI